PGRRHRLLRVRAPPPVRKRSPATPPRRPQSHPGRVLLRLRARPADTRLWAFPVGAPPPVRKRRPARTPTHPQSHPGRMLLQPVTPGGDPAQSTIPAAQPKAISGRVQCRKVGTTVSQIWLCWPSTFRPAVGPRVESEAGERASPRAAAVPTRETIASGL